MIDAASKRDRSAKAILDLTSKLDTAIATYIDSSTELGNERGQSGIGSPLNRVRLLADVQSALLLLLPSAKMPGTKRAATQAKFSRGLRIGEFEIMGRI